MKPLKIITISLFILGFAACKDKSFEPEPLGDPVSMFEHIWNDYNDHYANFAQRDIDWQDIYDQYRPQVSNTTTDDELYEIIKAMLLPLNDSHIKFTVPGKKTYNPNIYSGFKFEDSLFNLDVATSYLTSETKKNGYDYNTYGWIGDVGYAHFEWTTDNFVVIDEILEEFKDAKGLIVDFRHNGGGSFMYAWNNFGPFMDQNRLVSRVTTKTGPGEQFGEWFDWEIAPSGTYFDKPIVFITDRYTISAGERLTMAFKVLPNVTHIGDTTNGAISTFVGRELANGWSYSMVSQKVLYANGDNYEGVGIPPEITIRNKQTDMNAGKDETLELAISKF